MPSPLKILYVCSEAVPFIKTGGLADVSNALPRALRALGHDVRMALPCYGTIPDDLKGEQIGTCFAHFDFDTAFGAIRRTTLPDTDIPVYLIEHDLYFMRDHPYGTGDHEFSDNLERFCFFCLSVLDGVPQTGWTPDVVHCHDWHTAAIPAYLKTRLWDHPAWKGKASVLTIHNMAYQGRYPSTLLPKTGLGWELFSPKYLEFYGDINLMKAGILFASRVNTVSPTYAKEIQTEIAGHGLEGVLKSRAKELSGIANGVDHGVWNPSTDSHIPAPFSIDNLSGKERCKRELQRRLKLPTRDVPLFGMVSRLVPDKGLKLIIESCDALLAMDIQVVIQGAGEALIQDSLLDLAKRFPKKLSANLVYDEALAHQIYAGSDFYLMPSRTEPCGLSQLYAMVYGAVPIVHETGGLADSVIDATQENLDAKTATGFTFSEFTDDAFLEAVRLATETYEHVDILRVLQGTGMTKDWSWNVSAKAYDQLFREAIAKP